MKRNKLSMMIIAFILLSISNTISAQTLDMGVIENFTIYTVQGSLTNSDPSTITGNVGTDQGTITGFDAGNTSGSINNANALTAQAKIDLLYVYILLNEIPITNSIHPALFSNETVSPGVYLVPSAGSLNGNITLDAGNNANATFIIKFQGGLTGAASTTMSLINGARACNVFWIAEGAISIGASCTIKGTIIAHAGAITLGAATNLDGRILTASGGITFGPGVASLPIGKNTLTIDCVNICENPILGSVAKFALFTSSGAVSNTGISYVVGDLGTNAVGSINGFETSIFIGSAQTANTATAAAATDLANACTTLSSKTVTATHNFPFGNGEILTAGVYSVAGAGSMAGNLVLDGGGNTNAEFVFKIGGAFSVGAHSSMKLINGARRCNIFWVTEGAISMGQFSFVKGNFIAHGAAVNMDGNCFLEGRLLSTSGEVGIVTSTTYISNGLCASSNSSTLPIELISFTGQCEKQHIVLKWATAQEINNKSFTIERSIAGKNWEVVATIAGKGNSSVQQNYFVTDNLPNVALAYLYRLKQTDIDNKFKYGNVVAVTGCESAAIKNLSILPNPSNGQFNLVYSGDKKDISLIEIFNMQGVKIYQSNGFQSTFNLKNQADGMYIIVAHLNGKTITNKILIVR